MSTTMENKFTLRVETSHAGKTAEASQVILEWPVDVEEDDNADTLKTCTMLCDSFADVLTKVCEAVRSIGSESMDMLRDGMILLPVRAGRIIEHELEFWKRFLENATSDKHTKQETIEVAEARIRELETALKLSFKVRTNTEEEAEV